VCEPSEYKQVADFLYTQEEEEEEGRRCGAVTLVSWHPLHLVKSISVDEENLRLCFFS
jgi:hypothetical protein